MILHNESTALVWRATHAAQVNTGESGCSARLGTQIEAAKR